MRKRNQNSHRIALLQKKSFAFSHFFASHSHRTTIPDLCTESHEEGIKLSYFDWVSYTSILLRTCICAVACPRYISVISRFNVCSESTPAPARRSAWRRDRWQCRLLLPRCCPQSVATCPALTLSLGLQWSCVLWSVRKFHPFKVSMIGNEQWIPSTRGLLVKT
jgi:hypothetical protein